MIETSVVLDPVAGVFAHLLFLMIAAHAVADFPLQGAEMAAAKRPGGHPTIGWPVALAGHATIHGGAVALVLTVTGFGEYWWLGLFEAVTHAGIDQAKCRGRIGGMADQALHLACKAMWAAIVMGAA